MANKEKKRSVSELFGQRLRNARVAKGLSQVELTKILGYKHSGSISSIESGKTPPTIPSLYKIAEVLEVDLHWLITGRFSAQVKGVVSALRDTAQTQINELSRQNTEVMFELLDLQTRQADLPADSKSRKEKALQQKADDLQSRIDTITKALNSILYP